MGNDMQRNYVLTVALVSLLCLVTFIGCQIPWRKASRTPEQTATIVAAKGHSSTLRALAGAPATGHLAETLDYFFYAGISFLVIGGFAIAFGQKTAGGHLFLMGVFMTSVGVLFSQYPWVSLIFGGLCGIMAVIHGVQYYFTDLRVKEDESALETLAEVIQNHPEGVAIKQGIAEFGEDIEGAVRKVISPIKDKLRAEGRISAPEDIIPLSE